MKSAIYVGRVAHRRLGPRRHEFAYRLFMPYLDLHELPRLFDGRWLWSHEGRNVASFRRSDYLGDASVPLDQAVRDRVEEGLGSRPVGPIRMLTNLRHFGYCFNPVTFYYCFDAEDTRVSSVVAEITNTPWGERHSYVLAADAEEEVRARFAKAFHVSPFFDMDLEYDWAFSTPGDALEVRMGNERGTEHVFDATLRLERHEWSGANLARALLRHPWITAKVHVGIYWQALRLFAKRAPFFTHPDKRPDTARTSS